MELEGMLERIPSTEKILGLAWIFCWILAIWIHHIQFFITGLFCLFLTMILLGKLDKKEETKKSSILPAVFTMDKNTRTLKVQKVYEDNLKWDEHEICAGSASLPNGPIKEGDIVTNCEGNLAIRHIPSNKLFGGFNFEE